MDTIAEIAKTLGSFRAENLGEEFFSLYTRPAYFPKLLTQIPCFLQGGRGTGKTTVLRSLSYDGQYRLCGSNFEAFQKVEYIGIYYKLETGLVTAFSGADQDDDFWRRTFTHFINLQLTKLLCDFALWNEHISKSTISINAHKHQIFNRSLGLDTKPELTSIKENLDLALADLEFEVNNAADSSLAKSSAIGQVPRRFLELLSHPWIDSKTIYFVFDEYENLLEYQQQVLNTFVKQADSKITFKIGVRELGLKTRKTLNPQEVLIDPADYVLIDVSKQLDETEYSDFASNVIESRFENLKSRYVSIPNKVIEVFENLSEEEEATKLGAKQVAQTVKEDILSLASSTEEKVLETFSDRDLVLIKFLVGEKKATSTEYYQQFQMAVKDPSSWNNKVNNYGYASLFSIRKGKVGISKYYSGWKTFLALSGGNIRYLLQLVANSLIEHFKAEQSMSIKVSAKIQTDVAKEVGRKNILELEGLSTKGADLMKLVIGLGQVFHEMAVQGEKHAPEITQFEISNKLGSSDEIMFQVNEIMNTAVMHLAIIRTSGTKLGGPGDTRDFDYMLHPIFSPFFVYSNRRKRKFTIHPDEIAGLVTSPSVTIKNILAKQNRTVNTDMYDQLHLFGKSL